MTSARRDLDELQGLLGAEGGGRLAAIEHSVAVGALAAAAREAHSLRGAARVIGLEEAGLLAGELERLLAEAAAGTPLDWATVSTLVAELRKSLPAPGPAPVPMEVAGADATVLYVEDSAVNSALVERILARRGLRTVVAVTGAEGLALARSERPSLVLCDLRLPDIDGAEVARRLADDPETAKIPVVVVSGAVASDDADALRLPGVRRVLSKPFDVEGLLAVVDETLGA